MDVFYNAPPVTRTLTAATVLLSLAVWTNTVQISHFYYNHQFVWKARPELWRLITAFFITNPKLDILFTPYFMYSYGSHLEKNSPRFNRPGDFFTYILFVGGIIVGVNTLYLDWFTFCHALVLSLAWTYSQEMRGTQASFVMITIPVQWLPWSILLMTLIMEGPGPAKGQAVGIFAAHLYDFLTRLWPLFGGGQNYIQTPRFIRRLFIGPDPEPTVHDFTAQAPAARPSASTSGVSPGPIQPGAWGRRGAGNRLG